MRNESRIGTLALLLVLALVPFAHAIADPASKPESGEPVTATSAESSNTVGKEKPAEDSGEESPVDPFVPSETISADSAISFPVDI